MYSYNKNIYIYNVLCLKLYFYIYRYVFSFSHLLYALLYCTTTPHLNNSESFDKIFGGWENEPKLTIFGGRISDFDRITFFCRRILLVDTKYSVTINYCPNSWVLDWWVQLQWGSNLWREWQSSYHKCCWCCTYRSKRTKWANKCMCRRNPIGKPYAFYEGSTSNQPR